MVSGGVIIDKQEVRRLIRRDKIFIRGKLNTFKTHIFISFKYGFEWTNKNQLQFFKGI